MIHGDKIIVGGRYTDSLGRTEYVFFCGFDDNYGKLYKDPSEACRFKSVEDAELWIQKHPTADSLSLLGEWTPNVFKLTWEAQML